MLTDDRGWTHLIAHSCCRRPQGPAAKEPAQGRCTAAHMPQQVHSPSRSHRWPAGCRAGARPRRTRSRAARPACPPWRRSAGRSARWSGHRPPAAHQGRSRSHTAVSDMTRGPAHGGSPCAGMSGRSARRCGGAAPFKSGQPQGHLQLKLRTHAVRASAPLLRHPSPDTGPPTPPHAPTPRHAEGQRSPQPVPPDCLTTATTWPPGCSVA